MQRFLPKTLNQWLLAVAALSLPVGWLFGYGLLGAGLAFTLLCVAGARSALPRQSTAAAPQRAGMAATPARVERTTPSNLTLVEEMLAQGRTALLLRQQIAARDQDTKYFAYPIICEQLTREKTLPHTDEPDTQMGPLLSS